VSSVVPIIGGTSTLVLMLEYQFIISVGGIPSQSDWCCLQIFLFDWWGQVV